jgi:RNA polymerase sigma factor (sigma-70 family)
MSLSALETNVSLLCRVRDSSDQNAWAEFVELYTPMVFGYLRKSGVQYADAADLAQDVLVSVNQHIGRFEYNPEIGRFRGWLQTITRNKLRTFIQSRKRKATASGDSGVMQMLQQIESDVESDDERWEKQYRTSKMDWAMNRVRPSVQPNTWRAFWATSIEGQKTEVVAKELDMTTGAVYLAKSRVLARIRDQIRWIGDE